MPFRDPTLRPIGVARQIDREIHATVDVAPGRGHEPAHPTPGRAASATGRRTWNESSEDQPPSRIERRDLTERPDRTIFLVHRDDDTAAVGWVRREHEHDGDPQRRATRLGVVRSAHGERTRHEDERHQTPGNVASPQRCLDFHVCCTMRGSTWHRSPGGARPRQRYDEVDAVKRAGEADSLSSRSITGARQRRPRAWAARPRGSIRKSVNGTPRGYSAPIRVAGSAPGRFSARSSWARAAGPMAMSRRRNSSSARLRSRSFTRPEVTDIHIRQTCAAPGPGHRGLCFQPRDTLSPSGRRER